MLLRNAVEALERSLAESQRLRSDVERLRSDNVRLARAVEPVTLCDRIGVIFVALHIQAPKDPIGDIPWDILGR